MKFAVILSILISSHFISSEAFAKPCWSTTEKTPAQWPQKICFDKMDMNAVSSSEVNLRVTEGIREWKFQVVASAVHGGYIKFKAEGDYKKLDKYNTKLEYFGSIDDNGYLAEMDQTKIRIIFEYINKAECVNPNEEGNCGVWYEYTE